MTLSRHSTFFICLRILGGTIATALTLFVVQDGLGHLVSLLMPTDTVVRRLLYICVLIVTPLAVAVVWNILVLGNAPMYGFVAPYGLAVLALIVGVVSSLAAFTLAVSLDEMQVIYLETPQYSPMVLAIATVAFGAITEEVLHRHICMSAMLRVFKNIPFAQLVQATFFVSLHPQKNALLIASAAILFGQIYIFTKSFIIPAALHFGFNFGQEILYGGHFGFMAFPTTAAVAAETDHNDKIVIFNLLCTVIIYLYSSRRTSWASR